MLWSLFFGPVALHETSACCPFSGVKADGNVTLHSLTIFSTHEWFGAKPEVYFQCQGEDVVHLPDVEVKGQLYKFSGQESWQVAHRSLCKLDKYGSIPSFLFLSTTVRSGILRKQLKGKLRSHHGFV